METDPHARAFDLVVQNGIMATTEGARSADIGIRDGRITVLASRLAPDDGTPIVDAAGCVVVPGAIDVHTHFGNQVGDHGTADDYASGTLAAAFGGITTILNYCIQGRGESLESAVARDRDAAERAAMIDFSLHVIITDPDIPEFGKQLDAAVAAGCPSIKIFTAVDAFALNDTAILRVLRAARESGVVVNLHAEDGPLVGDLTRDLLAKGEVGISSLPRSRPPVAEAIAIKKVAAYTKMLGVPLYVVHVSSRAGLRAIAEARADGAEVYAETRPAYLFLDESLYEADEAQGRFVACWPPLRAVEDQAALWEGLQTGFIQTYATDHTSWMAVDKLDPGLSFDAVPGGFANVETSIGMLYSEGVVGGRISLERFVAVTASNPAKIFGLWPEKGAIAVGSDADLVLIDPKANVVVTSGKMHSQSDVEPYEGYKARAWPVTTISRGEVVIDRGRLLGRPGRGRFVSRGGEQATRGSTVGR